MSDRAQKIFAHHSEAIVLIDPYRDRILEANPAAATLLGHTAAELRTLPASRLFIADFSRMLLLSQAALHQGKAWSNEIHAEAKNGKRLQLEISASAFCEGDDQLLIFSFREAATLEDLRQLAEADSLHRHGLAQWKTIESVFREFERENQLILRAAGEGIYGVDAKGRTTFVNPAAEKMLGWRASDLINKDIHSTIHHTRTDGSHYPGCECHIYASFKDGKVHHVDDEIFWRKDGTHIAVEYTSTPIVDQGRLVGAVVIFRDVTERRQAEARLRTALDEVQSLKQRLELENAYLQEEYRAEHNYKEIVGHSTAIRRTIQQIDLVAPTDANVLITGESGTGKELIARAIHDSSTRHDRPLIRVNCASIPRELFESEFFGHVKGAFTGAASDRAGRFELADGGTLFLDEVGEIPLELQSKLLRVLQEQQFERVGDSRTRRVDVRIIAATNRDLKLAVSRNEFREDLYFRLNVFPIESAPLRERREDIPILAAHFLQRACKRAGKPELHLTVGDIRRIQAYPWPGNIRELINVIERSVILTRNNRLSIDLPEVQTAAPVATAADSGAATPDTIVLTENDCRQRERDNIISALRASRGKVFGNDGAAALLGVKPTTLRSRIQRHAIDLYRFKTMADRTPNPGTDDNPASMNPIDALN